MKTLKQIYNEICKETKKCCIKDDLDCIDCGIKAFKEWLKQKQLYHHDRKNVNDNEAQDDLRRIFFIDELLEDLKEK